MNENELPPLPPYIYGRETSPNEKVWPEESMHAYARAYAAAAVAAAVPPGWKAVPVEPPDEMLDAAQAKVYDLYRVDACRAWDAMLAAAPETPR